MSDPVEIVKAQVEAWNAHDLERYLDYYSDDAVYEGPRRRADGREGIRAFMSMVMEAFPDEVQTVRDTAVSGNTVYLRYSDTATHTGPIRWSAKRVLEPTGRTFVYEGVTEVRVVDGRIVYARDYFDLYEMLFVHLGLPFPSVARTT
jgi:uncharacterized protein (TIGR02246 family)